MFDGIKFWRDYKIKKMSAFVKCQFNLSNFPDFANKPVETIAQIYKSPLEYFIVERCYLPIGKALIYWNSKKPESNSEHHLACTYNRVAYAEFVHNMLCFDLHWQEYKNVLQQFRIKTIEKYDKLNL